MPYTPPPNGGVGDAIALENVESKEDTVEGPLENIVSKEDVKTGANVANPFENAEKEDTIVNLETEEDATK